MENIHSETAPDRYLHIIMRREYLFPTRPHWQVEGSLSALHPVVRDPCLRPSLVYKLHYLVPLISADSSDVSSPARPFLLSTCILVLSCLLVMTLKIALIIR